jgi:hypothetical protein
MRHLGTLILLSSASALAAPPSGKEILERQEDARKIPAFQSKATLLTAKEGDSQKTPKAFRWWRKLGGDGEHYVTLTRFDEPATIRGEGLLLREGKADNDVLLYLPRFKKVRRVEGQSQSTSFFGSVFSYSDLAVAHADESNAKVLREDACPGEQLKCWVVEITPARDDVRDRTGYTRSVQWVRQDNYVTVYGEFYDLKGTLWKKLSASAVTEVDPRAHKWLARHVVIEDVPAKRTTVLDLGDVKVNVPLEDTLFTEQSLSTE